MGITLEALAKKLNDVPTASEYRLRAALGSVFSKYNFRFNVPLYGYIADVYCQAVYLVIEVDGSYHVGRERYDERKNAVFTRNGVYTLRVSAERVMKDINGVLADIEAAIKERRLQMGLPEMEVDKRKYLRVDREIRPVPIPTPAPAPTLKRDRRRGTPQADGDPCAHCQHPVKIHERTALPKRKKMKDYCYIRWLACTNPECKTYWYKPFDEVYFLPKV